MRILIVDHYYEAFLRDHYRRHVDIAENDYATQLQSLLLASFGTSDSYSHFLQKRGHQAVETIANCEQLQIAWAREQGSSRLLRYVREFLKSRGSDRGKLRLLNRILEAQISAFRPEVIYVQDVSGTGRRVLNEARSRGCLVVGQLASDPPPDETLRGFDLLVTSLPNLAHRFRTLGLKAHDLPLGFDPRILERLGAHGIRAVPNAERAFRISFVGGLNPAVHRRRASLLDALCREFKVDVWGYGERLVQKGSPILRRFHGTAWGLDMYEVLAGSDVVFNAHIDVAENWSNNMRMFEATGVGALLVTERSRNLGDLFEIGAEVVAYNGIDELRSVLREILEDPGALQRTAAAGQERTLKDHTWADRIAELADVLEINLRSRQRIGRPR